MQVTINNGAPVPGKLDIRTEMIEIRSLTATKPDPNWTHIDEAGHFHAYGRDGKLPTLIRSLRQVACGGECGDSGCEGYETVEHECSICNAEVIPECVADDPVKSIPGPTSWEVLVEQYVEVGQSVSVRVTTPNGTYFGVAQSVGFEAESGRPTVSRLIGDSELGQAGVR